MEIFKEFLLENMVAVIGVVLVVLTVGPYLLTQRIRTKKVESKIAEAKKFGLHEPVSIHPVVDKSKCIGSGACIRACPGEVPHLHPEGDRIVICDLCGGEPECAKVCVEAGYGALYKGTRTSSKNYDLYAIKPEEITKNLVVNLYGEKGEELYNYFVRELRSQNIKVETGRFRAMMDVELVNDGPVTFILESNKS